MTESKGVNAVLVLDQHEDSDWKELPQWVREAAEAIGYTKKLWNKDKEPAVCEMDWKELTEFQQEAAKRLGYTRQLWDDDDDDDDSESNSSSSSNKNETVPGLVLDQHEDSDWNELPQWVREAAEGIGYTKKLWNKHKEPAICEMDWEELTCYQQEAAKRLGYTKQTWDDDEEDSNNVLVLDRHEDYDWNELPEWVREAAEGIGYTKKIWNRDKEPAVCEKKWEDLTGSQREAAKRLGYTSVSWDSDSDDDDSNVSMVAKKARTEGPPKTVPLRLEDVHKHPKRTIYCIQLYTETKDYKLRVKKDIGLAMYTNRPLEAGEFIVRSPVSPCVHEGLFEVSQNETNGVLSEERRGFAERFLEWRRTYGTKNRAGASNAPIDIQLEDFYNPSRTPKEGRELPRPEIPVYDLEIFEHEILLVEFVPPPFSPDHELPPQRRFEILSYDEGLVGLDGEKGYDPHEMQRPPTLSGLEARSLEVPGHFSNHSCGASSTAYDFMRVGNYAQFPFPSSSSAASSPPQHDNLPEWLSNEISNKERSEEIIKFSHLTARGSMEVGTEITTDYTRWHWSNADMSVGGRQTPKGYFLGSSSANNNSNRKKRWEWDDLSPRILRAAQILGYTKEFWESGEATTPSTMRKPWNTLTLQEQEAAFNLTGHTEDTWDERSETENGKDDNDDDDDSSSEGSLMDLEWAELSDEQRKIAAVIGHTEKTWNEGEHEDVLGSDLYFYNFRPEVRDAMVVLGETEATWENQNNYDGEYGDADPWFECLCGDIDCHSSKERGGFRGVKYFPLEEQCKLAPLCEPWVQQQFRWRLYQLERENKAKQIAEISDEKKD